MMFIVYPILFQNTSASMNSMTETGHEQVILFTRFPEPGSVKTRLISELGPRGAADLHSRMTQQVIRRIEPALLSRHIQLQVYFCGGSLREMRDWLGGRHSYHLQQGSDLGRRMADALSRSFRQGASRTILLGSDCPYIDGTVINTALEELHEHSLVLGPAADGGYYLIGLTGARHRLGYLFNSIDWGTDRVLSQTLRQAAKSGFSYRLLHQLNDIDRPEDLVYLNYHTRS